MTISDVKLGKCVFRPNRAGSWYVTTLLEGTYKAKPGEWHVINYVDSRIASAFNINKDCDTITDYNNWDVMDEGWFWE